MSGLRLPEREVNHTPLFSAEVKNDWSYTSAPHIRLRGVHKEYTFTFNFTVNCVMQYDRYGDSKLSCSDSTVRRFGDVIILVRLVAFIAGILMCCWAAYRTGCCLTHILIGEIMS